MARSLWGQKDLGKRAFVFDLTALERLELALASAPSLVLTRVTVIFPPPAEFQA